MVLVGYLNSDDSKILYNFGVEFFTPDLNLLDFYPQSHLEQLIYAIYLKQECLQYKPILGDLTDKNPQD